MWLWELKIRKRWLSSLTVLEEETRVWFPYLHQAANKCLPLQLQGPSAASLTPWSPALKTA